MAVPKEPKPPPKFPKPPPNPPNCGRGAGAEFVRLETTRTRRAAIMMRKSGDLFEDVFSVEGSGDD